MSITNIISAIGNNNSIYPLLVRDCGIEIPTKVALTYNQNVKESKGIAKLATRERLIDEYAVSAVWLGGIPLVDKIAQKIIQKQNFNPDVNLKLFNDGIEKENKVSVFFNKLFNKNYEKDIENLKEARKYQGVELNLNNKIFKQYAEDALKDLEKVKNNRPKFEKLIAGKFIASTAIPIALMGYVLPKLVFASSGKKIAQQREKESKEKYQFMNNAQDKDTFKNFSLSKGKDVSFGGGLNSTLANFSVVDKMIVTDGGYAVGRVGTARNKNEALDVAFKMSGMMFLNFIAPIYIAKFLDKTANKLFNLNVNLDPKILADKEFIEQVQNKSLILPENSDAKTLFEFIDKKENANKLFVKLANKFNKIKMLETGVRDPRAYVDVVNLGKFRDEIAQYAEKAQNVSEKEFSNFVKKAKSVKTFNIITNVAVSSFLLAYCLPKAQFAFRKLVTGSDLEPGIAGEVQRT